MNQHHEIIGIVTKEKFDSLNFNDLNGSLLFNQDSVVTDLDALNLDKNQLLHLVVDGGHGTMSNDGSPLTLNGKNINEVEKYINKLHAKNLLFQTIHLSSCYSASFIPLFKKILLNNGMIFCQTLSSTSNLDKHFYCQQKDLRVIGFSNLDSKVKSALDVLGSKDCFFSDSVYTMQDNTLHRFRVTDSKIELESHNLLIGSAQHDEDTIKDLKKIENYLNKDGIQIDDSCINTDQMEIFIRNKLSRCIRLIEDKDIPQVQAIDNEIFREEDPGLNLQYCCDKKYSWLIEDENKQILSYIIANIVDNKLFIHSFATILAARRQNLASALLENVINAANVEKKDIKLRVKKTNNHAIEFYIKHGFNCVQNIDEEYQFMSKIHKDNNNIYSHDNNNLTPQTF